MSVRSRRWTRRQFSQALAASAASGVLRRTTLASGPREAAGLAYVASLSAAKSESGAIDVFQVSGCRWSAVQQVPAAAPAHLERHPTLPVLYAVHNVGLWQSLPRGAVTAYSISPVTGHLTFRNTQPLSLAATHPRHAAVTPDGRYLLVAAERGGIYNVLPIAADGSLEAVMGIRKELGLLDGQVAKFASPRHLVSHPDGTCVVAADAGRGCITVLTLEGASIGRPHYLHTLVGTGPSDLALPPSGDWVLALHSTGGFIAAHRFHGSRLRSACSMYRLPVPGSALMAMDPSARFLVTATPGTLTCLSFDADTGHLSRLTAMSQPQPLSFLTFAPCGTHLLAVAELSGDIFRIHFDPGSGAVGRPRAVAQVPAATNMLFRSA